MTKYRVAKANEITDGERAIVELEGKPIGVFNIDGEYLAYLSWCAHQSGPCCEGNLTGTSTATFDPVTLETDLEWVRDDEILNCPWHGWEYDIMTGECLSHADISLPAFPVTVEDGDLFVDV